MRQGSTPYHTLFDSDEDEAVDPPTGPSRLNIGNSTRVGESEWHTVTKRRRRRSIQEVRYHQCNFTVRLAHTPRIPTYLVQRQQCQAAQVMFLVLMANH
jgi:hypothetical protein